MNRIDRLVRTLRPVQARPALFYLPAAPGPRPTLIDRLCRTLRPWSAR